jgi:hypothetical protein
MSGRLNWGIAMAERRTSTRQKSFLQGRIFFNNRRQSADCLVRDVSPLGARLVFADTVSLPDLVELYLSNKDAIVRAEVQWRRGKEVGVGFGLGDMLGVESGAAAVDVCTRVLKLETGYASLKKMVANLQAELRKLHSEPV